MCKVYMYVTGMKFMFYTFWHAGSETARAAAIIALALRMVVKFQPMAPKKIVFNCRIHMHALFDRSN